MTNFFARFKDLSARLDLKPPQPTTSPEDGPQSPGQPPLPYKPFKPFYRHWFPWAVLVTAAGAGGLFIGGTMTLEQMRQKLPDPKLAMNYVRDGSVTIKAADGTVLQQLGPATREKLSLDQVPLLLREAFLASEDRKFYEHEGVDYRAIARATLANLTAGEVVEGASTITQQLSRIIFLGQDQTLTRKLREALLAQKMEQTLTKDQILERYLNLVYLGSGAYGVADAAWVYFSKSVNQLTLSEIAMIAGLAPAPSSFSPLVNLDAARQRRDLVLSRMVEAGFITPAEMEQARAEPLALKPATPRNFYSEMPYFTSYVQQQLPGLISPEEMEAGGLTVETTVNPQWQKHAQEVVAKAIEDYGSWDNFSAAALVAVDPRNGEIKALVGGNDFSKSQFNRATQAQRQPGSTFKTFVYTTAIAGGFSPYKNYVDAKLVVDGYEPQNYSRKFRGSMSIRDALVSSINVIAVKVLIDTGFQPVMDMAARMGIKSKLLPAYSLALGSLEVNLLELTGAYGTLAAKGQHVEPHGITRVINRFGKVIYDADYKPEQAVDEKTAAIMTWMLRGVVDSGTGGNAALNDRSVAGKTGTSENRRDLWFVGYIPQMVTGVWLGNDDNQPTYGASSTAALVWRRFMATVTEGMEVEAFPEMPDLYDRKSTVTLVPVKPNRIAASTNPDSDYGRSAWGDSGQREESSGSWERQDDSAYSPDGGSAAAPAADPVPMMGDPPLEKPLQDVAPLPDPGPAIAPVDPLPQELPPPPAPVAPPPAQP